VTADSATPPAPPHVLRLSSFRHFLASRALSAIAFQGSAVAIGWLVYDKTRNPFDLGLVGLFQFLPMLILTLVAGHLADQFDRRRIGLIAQALEAVAMGVIAFGVFFDALPVWGIFAAVFALGSAQAFERPTMAALLPSIVPPAQLQSAVATSTSVMQTCFIIGPAVGGLLYGVGPVVPFVFAALCYVVASVNVIAIARPANLPQRAPVTVESIFAGVTFIKSKPMILGSISLDLFAVLLGGATAMLPVYARDILHAGPEALGLLRTAPAVGAVAMALTLARFPLRHGVGMKMLIAVAIFGLATVVFAYSTDIALSIAMLVVLGAADTVSVVIRSSLVQLLTPDHMRGRVNAVNSLFIGTSNQLGEFRAGTMGGLIGPVAAVAFGGIGTLAVVALWAVLFPSLRRVDTLSG
jgi:MFS family permease